MIALTLRAPLYYAQAAMGGMVSNLFSTATGAPW
jgi:hypothetical protein